MVSLLWLVVSYRHLYHCHNFAKLHLPGCFESRPRCYTANQARNLKKFAGKKQVVRPSLYRLWFKSFIWIVSIAIVGLLLITFAMITPLNFTIVSQKCTFLSNWKIHMGHSIFLLFRSKTYQKNKNFENLCIFIP